MTDPDKKRMWATVSENFYNLVKQTASRRYLHRRGYMTKFLVLALKILLKIDRDPKLVKEINKFVNNNYTHSLYDDRAAQFVEDAVRYYLKKHNTD
jgi:hypothetical protein